jgi:hypothetical protein
LYRDRRRILAAPDWAAAVELAADPWAEYVADTGLYVHRRSDVAALNNACRERMAEAGRIDLERQVDRFAPGDRIVQLAPDHRRGLVNGQDGIVVDTDPQAGRVDVVWDDGRRVTLADDALDEHHLSYGYCTTVHRAQGQSIDRAVLFADGGRRELGYVGMSRARHNEHVVAVADNVDQAVEQLRRDWQSEQRERWVIDTEHTLDRLERATSANLADALDESTLDPLTPGHAEPGPLPRRRAHARALNAKGHREYSLPCFGAPSGRMSSGGNGQRHGTAASAPLRSGDETFGL